MINSYSIFMQKYILYLARRVIGQSLILVNYAADHFSGTFELCMTKSRLDYGSTIAGTTNKFRTETNSVKLNFNFLCEYPITSTSFLENVAELYATDVLVRKVHYHIKDMKFLFEFVKSVT